jgi:choline dehydrogenase-like flavoprotein
VDFRNGVRLTREIVAQPAFDAYRGPPITPGDDVQSDDEIDAWVRSTTHSAYVHYIIVSSHATALLGPLNARVIRAPARTRRSPVAFPVAFSIVFRLHNASFLIAVLLIKPPPQCKAVPHCHLPSFSQNSPLDRV